MALSEPSSPNRPLRDTETFEREINLDLLLAIRPLLIVLTAVMFVYTPIEALTFDPPEVYFITGFNIVLTAAFATAALAVTRGQLNPQTSHPLLAFLTLLTFLSVVDSFIARPDLVYSIYIIVILVVSGSFMLWLRWYLLVATIVVVTWSILLAAWTPSEHWMHHTLALIVAVVAGLATHMGRNRILGRLRASLAASRKARQQLDQAARLEALGNLAGGIAHDFNNLLAPALSAAELALDEPDALSPQMRADWHSVRAAVLRARELTDKLLAMSRAQTLTLARENLVAVVDEAKGMLDRLIREDIHITTTNAGTPLWVEIDRRQVVQVILTLALRAQDALPHGGRLTLTVAVVDGSDRARLEVKDNGQRLAQDALAHIFEPVFDREGSTFRGLGLASSHGIVKQHGGSIEVASSAEGTTFTIGLPLAEPPAAVRARGEAGPIGDQAGKLVLVVEDEFGVRTMVGRILRRAGYTVQLAATPSEAIAFAADPQQPIALVLTDVIMPEMDGVQLGARLRAERPGLPVAYISGYPAQVLAARGVDSHPEAYLAKPFTAEALVEHVSRAIARQAAAPEA